MPRKRKRAESAQKGWDISNRPKQFKWWSYDSMKHAVEAVKEGMVGLNIASMSYGVTRTTMIDRISGRIGHGTNLVLHLTFLISRRRC